MQDKAAFLCVMLALAACGRGVPKVDGQVVANVNGEAITRADLDAEMRKIGAAPSSIDRIAGNEVLNGIVTRKLIVQAAKAEDLDKSQNFILQRRQANETILATIFANRLSRSVRAPQEHDVRGFIDRNPWRFDRRQIFSIDQIRLSPDDAREAWLKPEHTIDGVVAVLTAHNVPYERSQVNLDSATLDKRKIDLLLSLPPGEPFALNQDRMVLISSITGREPAPLTGQSAYRIAAKLLSEESKKLALEEKVGGLRRNAKVEYQAGFPASATAN